MRTIKFSFRIPLNFLETTCISLHFENALQDNSEKQNEKERSKQTEHKNKKHCSVIISNGVTLSRKKIFRE